MRKRIFGKRLKRNTNQRKALFRNLMRDLILHERIKTTEAKAKAIKGQIERLVTVAKKKEGEAFRNLEKVLIHKPIVEKLIKQIAPRFATRPGGYTRIIRIGTRVKDAAPVVFLEWVESEVVVPEVMNEKSAEGKTDKKTKKKERAKGKASSEK